MRYARTGVRYGTGGPGTVRTDGLLTWLATTPDQDLRVQQAMSILSSNHNLVTAVVTPGVDAPNDAPPKAFKAGGMVYKADERREKYAS
jgi:hypothetical protein